MMNISELCSPVRLSAVLFAVFVDFLLAYLPDIQSLQDKRINEKLRTQV